MQNMKHDSALAYGLKYPHKFLESLEKLPLSRAPFTSSAPLDVKNGEHSASPVLLNGTTKSPTPLSSPTASPVPSRSTPNSTEHSVELVNKEAPATGLVDSASDANSIYVLSTSLFSELHQSHLLNPPPDSVLFPFLHGLEGGNEALCGFFLGGGVGGPSSMTARKKITVPPYRGLMWVICEDDLDNPEKDLRCLVHPQEHEIGLFGLTPPDYDEDSDSYFSSEDELDDLDEEETSSESFSTEENGAAMDVDVAINDSSSPLSDTDNTDIDDPNNATYMHPVAHRPAPMTKPMLNTRDLPMDMEMPTSSSFASTGSEDIDMRMDVESCRGSESLSSPSPLTTSTSPSTSPTSQSKARRERKRSQSQPPQPATPILTCTFRPHQLLRRIPRANPPSNLKRENSPISPSAPPRVGSGTDFEQGYVQVKIEANDEEQAMLVSSSGQDQLEDWSAKDPEWEYHLTPLAVPDGISLRNFGCQVAILAALSDIVVYSPVGKSANSQRLAAQFKEAIERKRRERIANGHAPHTLPRYNVFILDAGAEEIRKDLLAPLCVRVKEGGAGAGRITSDDESEGWFGKGVISPSPKPSADYFGDAKVKSGEPLSMDVDSTQESSVISSSPSPSQGSGSKRARTQSTNLPANTVDFAQREREEMRELTRSSEIIRIPVVKRAAKAGEEEAAEDDEVLSTGQVWLGNVHDVPLPVDTYTFHPNGGMEIEGLEGAELETREWETLGTSHQPPSNPLGFDICIECHDAAPLPTKDHLRMVEERLTSMDQAWRSRQESDSVPRPPPTAANIIHLLFPSSPTATPSVVKDAVSIVNWLGGLVGVGDEWEDDEPEPECTTSPPPHLTNVSVESPNNSVDVSSSASSSTSSSSAKHTSSWSSFIPTFPLSWSSGSSAKPAETGTTPKDSVPNPSTPPTISIGSNNGSASGSVTPGSTSTTPRTRSFTSPAAANSPYGTPAPTSSATATGNPYPTVRSLKQKNKRRWSRPLKVLIYSSDGYTESSVPALCLLMAFGVYGNAGRVPSLECLENPRQEREQRGMSLPEAYLQLQLGDRRSEKGKRKIGRSFFVYQSDLGFLRKVEHEYEKERKARQREMEEKEKERKRKEEWGRRGSIHLEEARRERIKKDREGSVDNGSPGKKGLFSSFGTNVNPYVAGWGHSGQTSKEPAKPVPVKSRPSAKSVSFASPHTPPPTIPMPVPSTHSSPPTPSPPPQTGSASASLPSLSALPEVAPSTPLALPPISGQVTTGALAVNRPRSSTFAGSMHNVLPGYFGSNSLHEQKLRAKFFNEAWFNDSRFDGSFPSRVLDGVYLGNLNHASNVYMLQALGITHVVSVGECALIPPGYGHGQHQPQMVQHPFYPNSNAHYYSHVHHGNTYPMHGHASSVPPTPGSLYLEERAGRIKVLDIQGVCDDGIDTLDEGLLGDICEWMDGARREGGQILVHCRVGVSRSATVVIAYVMKSLNLPLVDAYLIVRSRRLSVLIQPNMRLLYNLCAWEVRLGVNRVEAKISERRKALAGQPWTKEQEDKLREDLRKIELSTVVSWPYLAKEVHRLNEKYLG
ncbi:tyrosine/serine/threonine protein phosphatase pps1 [Marasmius sp. AFHP31]|nr:tyrosine/serine/threonine protein phosphatase pps1 [Marasmius sp. AFHP31]